MDDNFWERYKNVHESTGLVELPIFHIASERVFEDINSSQWILKNKTCKEDTFYNKKLLFFSYGNPVYFDVDFPIVLGFHIDESLIKDDVFVSPTDTGRIVKILSNDGKGIKGSKEMDKDSFRDKYTDKIPFIVLINAIKNYISTWFTNHDIYCKKTGEKGVEFNSNYQSILVDEFLKTYITVENKVLEKFLEQELLENYSLISDRRNKTVEIALEGELNLVHGRVRLVYLAYPESDNKRKLIEDLFGAFDLDELIICEYPDPAKCYLSKGEKHIIEYIQDYYYKEFDI